MSETERTLLIADLSGYTALTETHGATHASDIVLRFGQLADASLEPGVTIVDRVGDQVLCVGEHTDAVLRCALRLYTAIEHEPDFLAVQAAIHRGAVVERAGRLFGMPLNVTARLASLARAGQILCTERVAAVAREHPGITAYLVGERRFKNVSLPVVVYELARIGTLASSVIDPVCRMQVKPLKAAAAILHQGVAYHFCSAECATLFGEAPDRYARSWSGKQ
jgi:adenylate cyclase